MLYARHVNNNPLRYTDPSGHGACDGPYKVPECEDEKIADEYGHVKPKLKGLEIFRSPVPGVEDDSPGFGQARGTYMDTDYKIYHPGVDLGNELGVDVYACAPGIVVYASYNEDMGYTVIIVHDVNGVKVYSIYAHLGTKDMTQEEAIFVKKGDTVDYDTHVGQMGNTKGPKDNPEVTSPHLHFEIRTSLNVNPSGKFPLQSKQWWMNQDGGRICNPWTNCWLDLGVIYGYDPTYDPDIANGPM